MSLYLLVLSFNGLPPAAMLARPELESNICTAIFRKIGTIEFQPHQCHDGILPVVGGTLFRAGGTLLLAAALTPGRDAPLQFNKGSGE